MDDERDLTEVSEADMLAWVKVAHSARLFSDVLYNLGGYSTRSRAGQVIAELPEEPVSMWCRQFLAAALEHMLMWANYAAPLKFSDEAVVEHTLRPAQTLARGALEAASQAVWIMSASTPTECLRRHASLIIDDLDEQRKAASHEAAKAGIRERRDGLISQLSDRYSAADLRFPGYLAIVKAAATEVATNGTTDGVLADPEEVVRTWRASAGSAHGKRWPSVEQTILTPDGEFVTPDPAAITRMLDLANAVVSYGVLRYVDFIGWNDKRAGLVEAARARLEAAIPRHDTAASGSEGAHETD